MLNQLLKVTLISSLLLWLRPRWRGLLTLSVSVVLVHVLHGEYLGYVELSGNDAFLVWSFVLKWLALLCAVTVYLVMTLSSSRGEQSGEGHRRIKGPASSPPEGEDDGFEFLRRKKNLDSRAEKLLSRQDS